MVERVVVTGMGAISPLGNDVESSWKGLVAGKSGIAPICSFDTSSFTTRIAGEVKGFDGAAVFGSKEARRMDRVVQLGVAAALEAVRDSDLRVDADNAERVGVIMASGIGGIHTLMEQAKVLETRGPDRVSPFLIPMMIVRPVARPGRDSHRSEGSQLLRRLRLRHQRPLPGRGVRGHPAGGCRRGGGRWRRGPHLPIGLAGFASMRALSTRNDEPQRASRPFDAGRDGFVMAEGAGVPGRGVPGPRPGPGRQDLRRAGRATARRPMPTTSPPRPRGRRGRRPGHAALALDEGRPGARGGGLHQRPRHLHPAQRPAGDHGHQAGVRRPGRTTWPSPPPSP